MIYDVLIMEYRSIVLSLIVFNQLNCNGLVFFCISISMCVRISFEKALMGTLNAFPCQEKMYWLLVKLVCDEIPIGEIKTLMFLLYVRHPILEKIMGSTNVFGDLISSNKIVQWFYWVFFLVCVSHFLLSTAYTSVF